MPWGARSLLSSITISSHATITARPISNTRQLGRPLPVPSMSDSAPADGAGARGSRNRATTAIATKASVAARIATTNTMAARPPASLRAACC